MSPTEADIRKEVDEVVKAISNVVSKLKAGVNPMSLISIMPDFMEVLNTGQFFQVLSKDEKAAFFGEVFDALTGEEEFALIPHIGPVGPATTEKFLDASKAAVVELIQARLQ